MEEKKQRGGARPGAGRKKGKTKIQACFQIEAELMEEIKGMKDRNMFVNNAIRERIERGGVEKI